MLNLGNSAIKRSSLTFRVDRAKRIKGVADIGYDLYLLAIAQLENDQSLR